MTSQRWAQIELIFHRAAECDGEQRSILLKNSCQGDEDLRREVEMLLCSDGEASGYLDATVDAHLADFAFPLKGLTIDHYWIEEGLDHGGMGQIYKAQDIRLGRAVALKFLPEDLSDNAGALSRFEREARAASALEHASICPVYEYGNHDGIPFIVMPLLRGKTLRDTIEDANRNRSHIASEDLINWAIQIADGLDAAHRQGLIHRDIKPANIFITTEGRAKILDFGIAKTKTNDFGPTPEAAVSTGGNDTFDPLLSRVGTAIGTAGYMSPEQIRGDQLDARSDLFSFGSVLYEMATGQRAFRGDCAEILGQILTTKPTPTREITDHVPTGLERIICKALNKNVDLRYQSAEEIRVDLENVRRRTAPANMRSRWIKTALGSLFLLCAFAAFWVWNRRPETSLTLPDFKLRQLTTNSSENHLLNGSISPDGSTIAYTDLRGLHIKRLDSGQVRAVSLQGQTVDTYNNYPSWFADSRSFVVNTIPAENTSEHTPMNATIWKVSVPSGDTHKLRENAFAWSVSPDGSQIAFAAQGGGRVGPREVWLMDPGGENARKLYDTDENSEITAVGWSPDGQRISYVKSSAGEDAFYSRDLKRGHPMMTMPSAELNSTPGLLMLPDNRALYSRLEPGAPQDTCNFWVAKVDPNTLMPAEALRRLTNWTGFCMDPTSATKDGKKIAFLKWTSHRTIYLAELEAGGIAKSRHFTIDEVGNTPIDWTSDGRYIVFWSVRDGNVTLMKQRSDGENEEMIVAVKGSFAEPVVSADGKWLLWLSEDTSGAVGVRQQVMRVSISGGVPEPVFQVPPGTRLQCARYPSAVCFLAERTEDRKHVVVTEFDPLRGRGALLAKFDMEAVGRLNVALSYDGNCLALMPGLGAPIRLISLRGRPERQIQTPGLNAKQFIRWSADGKGLYVTNGIKAGIDLFLLDMAGHLKKLWHNDGDFAPIALESPDMRHLAIQGSSLDENLWLMENP